MHTRSGADIKISHELPPNWNILVERYGAVWGKTVVTYGQTCYAKYDLPDDLIVHESVHMAQQKNPEEWWEKYYSDKKFRLEQELEAYRAQYQYFKSQSKDRNLLFKVRDRLARDLSGHLYGNVISYEQAMTKIAQKS